MNTTSEREWLEGLRPEDQDQLYVNDARTMLVTVYSDGTCTLATREHPSHTWGPPTYLRIER